MDVEQIIAFLTALLGLAGLIYTGIRYYRGDRGAIAEVATRKRFLRTWAAVGLLALLIGMALWLSIKTAADQTDLAQLTAENAQKTSDDTLAYLQGEQGLPGVPGATGEGTPGLPGQPGAVGTPGTPGAAGPTGPAGEAGAAGGLGPEGLPGAMGSQGSQGSQGPAGPAGPKGDTGTRGNQGNPGQQGEQGPTGPQGIQGNPGNATSLVPTTGVNGSASDTSRTKSVVAICPSGKISGGGFLVIPSTAGIVVTHSGPQGFTGWTVTAEAGTIPPTDAWQLLTFASCLG